MRLPRGRHCPSGQETAVVRHGSRMICGPRPSLRVCFRHGWSSRAWRAHRGADRVRGNNMLRWADKARVRRLWDISAGTASRGNVRHRWAAPPSPPPPPSLREGCMSHSTPGAPRTPPFYGWWMVWLGGFLSSLIKTAIHKGFPVFVAPVREGFGASNAAVALIFSLARAQSGPTGLLAGWFIDRFGPLCSARTPSSSLWTITIAARIIVRDYNRAAEGLCGHDTMHAPAPPYLASHWHAADAAGR
jgi:hypothetical protein